MSYNNRPPNLESKAKSDMEEDDVDRSFLRLKQVLDEEVQLLNGDSKKVFIGGFS